MFSALIKTAKWLFDSNEFPWTLPLPVWAPPRQRALRQLRQVARKRMRGLLIARQGWFRTTTQIVAWPVISTLKAAIATRNHQVSAPEKIAIFATYCRLQWIHNIRISDQEQHALMLPTRREHANDYMICRENQALIDLGREHMGPSSNLNNKLGFADFCAQEDIPTPKIVARSDRNPVNATDSWPKSDLLLKPANRSKGAGIEVLRYDETSDQWLRGNGIAISPKTLPPYARQQYQDRPWVLQPFLKNSPLWDFLSPACLATARVITGRLDQNSPPVCIAMYLRIPRNGAIIDNLSAGGIGTQVDLKTGRLSSGHIYLGGFQEHTNHPDTGFPIKGQHLPEYDKIIELALKAHARAVNWDTIGWDASLTAEGPVLIEANLHWAIIPRSPVIDTPYIEALQYATQDRAGMKAAKTSH